MNVSKKKTSEGKHIEVISEERSPAILSSRDKLAMTLHMLPALIVPQERDCACVLELKVGGNATPSIDHWMRTRDGKTRRRPPRVCKCACVSFFPSACPQMRMGRRGEGHN